MEEIIKVVGWTTIGIIGFVAICVFIGVTSVEISEWAVRLYNFGKKLRKKMGWLK